jgi:ABC-type microcin C transport system permease subunit YejE
VGQRAGEFRHAREGYWIEWVIVVLLAAELVVMLLEYFG